MSFPERKKFYTFGILGLCLCSLWTLSLVAGLKEKKKTKSPTDWSRPETIDPLEEGIYGFLDAELNPLEYRAAEAYKAGNFREAAQYYLSILRLDYADARAMYNLACCYAMMGNARHASNLLIKAVDAGFRDMDLITKNRAFRKARIDQNFSALIKRLEEFGDNLGSTIYLPGPRLFPCRIHLPDGYNKNKRYPLVIGLHGNGGSAEGMASLRKFLGKLGFIFASPDGPYPYRMQYRTRGKMRSWEIQIQDEELWKVGDPLTVQYIKDTAAYLSALYPVDSVYLLGHSQGAAYAYITGIKNPGLFRGIVCFGGLIPSMDKSYSQLREEDLERGSELRVFIAHGRKDPALNVNEARKAKALLERYGFNPAYVEFEGGHEVSPDALKKAAAWILEK